MESVETLEVTTMTSRGQVVIPQNIRDALHLSKGVKFIVVGDNDTVVLKRIQSPSVEELKSLLTRSRAFAKKQKLKKSDVNAAISRARKKR